MPATRTRMTWENWATRTGTGFRKGSTRLIIFVISVVIEIVLDRLVTFQYLLKYENAERRGGVGRSRPGQPSRCFPLIGTGRARRNAGRSRGGSTRTRAEHADIPF